MFDDKNWMKGSSIKNTKIPNLGGKIENALDHWIGPYLSLDGHEAIEKILTIVGNYEFKKVHKEIVDENTFKLLTKDDRKIEIGFYYGDIDNPEQFSIKEGNNKDIYEVLYRNYSDELLVDRYKTIEIDTGFEQYYCKLYDCFSKQNGEDKIFVTIYNTEHKCVEDYYFIEEDVKKEFKEKEFNNIMEVYNFISSKYPSFSIEILNKHMNQLEYIKVSNNNVKEIKLIRGTNRNRYLIHEVFPDEEIDQSVIDGLSNDVETIHRTQDEIKLRLK